MKSEYMVRRHMAQVHMLEAECFGEHAWRHKEFLTHLRRRNGYGKVVTHHDALLAYILYETHKHHVMINSLAVSSDVRRMGLGSMLVTELKDRLRKGQTRITLKVRETNLDAQLFFRWLGFRWRATMHDQYEIEEAAYLMSWRQRQECKWSGNVARSY